MTPVVYLHGFASGPSSGKAQFFRRKFAGLGIPLSVPDLADGDFEHLTISGQLRVIERIGAGRPLILIGSSMGGYLAALYAARHPEVERLVLLAPAFDFSRRWPLLLGQAAIESWRATGVTSVFHYGEGRQRRLSYGLVEDAASYEDFPDARQPTLILHGIDDPLVPLAASAEFVARHPDAKLIGLRSGHELTDVVERLWEETATFFDLSGMPGPQL